MMDILSESLQSIRDIEGVYGSFVISRQGSVIDRDMPAVFDDSILEQAGIRIARIYDTFQSVGSDLDTCQLRFTEHKLYTRKLTSGYLCIMGPLTLNMPTLRMAANLVVRRINPVVANFSEASRRPRTTSPPPQQPQQPQQPAAAAEPPPAAKPPPPPSPPPVPTGSAPRTRRTSQHPIATAPPNAPRQRPSRTHLVYRGQKIKE